jgi:hypothetical protein
VYYDLILRFVTTRWGKDRAGSLIRENLDRAVNELVETVAAYEPGFYSERGYTVEAPRYPHVTVARPVKYVPWGELFLAVEHTVRDTHVISDDELSVYAGSDPQTHRPA